MPCSLGNDDDDGEDDDDDDETFRTSPTAQGESQKMHTTSLNNENSSEPECNL